MKAFRNECKFIWSCNLIRKVLDKFLTWIFLVLEVQSDISIRKFDLLKHNRTQNILMYGHNLCCLQWLEKNRFGKK